MITKKSIFMGTLVFIFSSHMALAFNEEPLKNIQNKPANKVENSSEKQLKLRQIDPANSKKGTGIQITIPGIGTLGELPKLDFGLELLYGADNSKSDQIETDLGPDDASDVTIRGSVKHRF